MAGRFTRRLQKELLDLQRSPPTGVKLEDNTTRLDQWRIHLTGADGSLYAGEHFVLRFRFGNNYPMEAPEVVFEGPNIPMHGHIYSNGHICLNVLYNEWSPALSVQSICLSLLSMLSSSPEKSWPPDNDTYVRRAIASPKQTSWAFHDDTV